MPTLTIDDKQYQADIFAEGNMLAVKSKKFSPRFNEEIKTFHGVRFDWDRKIWMITNNARNQFQMAVLMGYNPYAWFDQEVKIVVPNRKSLWEHQRQMLNVSATYRTGMLCAEPGLGKTLSMFELMEHVKDLLGHEDWWWIGPISALAAYEQQCDIWEPKVKPRKVMTYEGLVKTIKNWTSGQPAPRGIVFDEFSRCKSPFAQRSQAAQAVREAMVKDWGEREIYSIGLTGTPSPKSPADWFFQVEIVQPGFLREGNIYAFKNRLAVTEKRENEQTKGVYSAHITWKDNPKKCGICGDFREHHLATDHTWEKSVDEVSLLHRRLKGIAHVYLKKDWLKHLPEKNYRLLRVKPNRATLNVLEAIKSSGKSAIQILTLARELSDGFQYTEKTTGELTRCNVCTGSGTMIAPDYTGITNFEELTDTVPMGRVPCENCGGQGSVPQTVRDTSSVRCPKDGILEEVLDDHDEDGRLVVYGGFTGTIDRIKKVVRSKGWDYICLDGRGWENTFGGGKPKDLLNAFQDKSRQIDKITFLGHPVSGGMGLTLTESSEILHYSNCFDGEARMQADNRIHREGMDLNKGATISDIIHLPTDELVLKNLLEKKRLQDMTMGQLSQEIEWLQATYQSQGSFRT